jgi:hypothetical protein
MHDELPDVTRWGPVIHRYEANSGASSDPRVSLENARRRYFAVDLGTVEMLVSRATYDDLPRLARIYGRILVDERRDGASWHTTRISTR